jgi:metallo-beta-lactamase class B
MAWIRIGVALAGLALAAATSAAAQPSEWTQPVKPFRIAPHIYYVGTKGLAAYLVTSSAGAVLIDGTVAENAPLIERNIEAVGVPLTSVKWLFCDHAHSDHAGALAKIKLDTGARFAASAGDRVALERGAPRGDTDYDQTGFHFPPIKVDRVVQDGDRVTVGDAVLTAHLTPGHTPGCTSWSTTVQDRAHPLRVLFLCSITVAGNRLVNNRAYPAIDADYETTFAELSTMRADIVLTSHPDVDIADVLGREARLTAGDRRAFIDPTALQKIVARSKRDFEDKLSKARRAQRPATSLAAPGERRPRAPVARSP